MRASHKICLYFWFTVKKIVTSADKRLFKNDATRGEDFFLLLKKKENNMFHGTYIYS